MLLDPKNEFSEVIDPVFAVLLRATCGSEVITKEVFAKIRKSWCGDDLPVGLNDIIQTKSNAIFVALFGDFSLSFSDQLKMTALKQLNIVPQLVEESEKRRR